MLHITCTLELWKINFFVVLVAVVDIKVNKCNVWLTWSGFSPGGTQVYSSRAHPESSSEWANVCRVPGGGAWPPFDVFALGTWAPLLALFIPAPWLDVVWLSIELFSWPFSWCWPAFSWSAAAAAMTADVAAASGSEPVKPLNEELWSSLGHLQFLHTCLKKYRNNMF